MIFNVFVPLKTVPSISVHIKVVHHTDRGHQKIWIDIHCGVSKKVLAKGNYNI